jgi:sugar lactone lactonase YvrE
VRAEQITRPLATHGEGPCWLARTREVAWVDMLDGRMLATGLADGATRAIDVPGPVAALVRPRSAGGYVVGVERGVALMDDDGEADMLCEPIRDGGVRMNDGGCDPQGRLWCGSMAYDARPGAGSLYRVDPDGSVEAVLDGVTISNGIGWTPDGATAFYVDTATGQIDAFAFDGVEGSLGDRRCFAAIPAASGQPDGLAVDAEGGVWVALWEGGAVHRYAPDGSLDAVVPLPCSLVTACAFGGDDLSELYITTSRLDLPEGAERAAGALFLCEPGVRGQPVLEFAG